MNRQKALFWLVVAANLAGAAYGFIFYYGPALLQTPLHLWLFVPDCPLYALLFAAALLLTQFRGPKNWFNYVVAASAMKYGFWTVFALASYPWFYFSGPQALTYTVLFIGHIGLLIEPIALIGKIRVTKPALSLAFAWFIINDLADYLLGLHPPLPESEIGRMFIYTIAMSIAFAALSAFMFARLKSPPVRIFYNPK